MLSEIAFLLYHKKLHCDDISTPRVEQKHSVSEGVLRGHKISLPGVVQGNCEYTLGRSKEDKEVEGRGIKCLNPNDKE